MQFDQTVPGKLLEIVHEPGTERLVEPVDELAENGWLRVTGQQLVDERIHPYAFGTVHDPVLPADVDSQDGAAASPVEKAPLRRLARDLAQLTQMRCHSPALSDDLSEI